MPTRIAIMPGIVMLLIVLAGLVITFVALRKRGRTALIVLLVAGVAGILLAFVTFARVSYSRYNIVGGITEVRSVASLPSGITEVRSVATLPIWSEGIDGHFAADVYPSLKAAALGLARQTVQDLEPFLSNANTSEAIHVYGEPTEGQGLTQEAIDAFVGRLQESLRPRTLVLVEQAPMNRVAPNAVAIWLQQPRWTAPPALQHAGLAEATGSLKREIRSSTQVGRNANTRRSGHTVHFMLKPWVDSFSNFVNRQGQGPGRYEVARSYETCTDAAEAREQAMAQACAQVKESISKLNGSLQEALTVDFHVTPQDLETAEIVEDSFAQSFQGTVGKIWRHALLLDCSTDKLVGLRQTKIKQSRRAHLTFARLAGSALGLAFLIFILYIFLNAATKGYYTIALRSAALLLILMLGAVVFFLG